MSRSEIVRRGTFIGRKTNGRSGIVYREKNYLQKNPPIKNESKSCILKKKTKCFLLSKN